MDVFDLYAKLTLDISQYTNNLETAQGQAQGFGSSIKSGFGAALKVAGAALTAATTAAVGFGKSSVDAATSFESAFTGVRKTVDATEEEFAQLSNWIMEASTKMASSKESIAETMEIAGQLGISGVGSLEKFTETMVMLGDTTNLSSEEAAGALARFMNITGDSAENADRIGSVIVDLGNHFATTESDIVNMSTRLASAGTIAGLTANDILALSTAMSSVGIQAEAGGTAMSQTLAKMEKAVADGGDDLKKFAAVAGMSAKDFAEVWKGAPIQAVQAFIGGLGELNEADESVILTLEELGLKGIRQTNMLQALALSSEMLGSAVDMANTAYEENIALSNEATLRYQTTESAAVQTAEAFKNLKVVIGQELLPAYSNLMAFSKAAMEAMTQGFQEGGLEGFFASFGTAISDGLNAIVQKLPEAISLGSKLIGAIVQGFMDNIDSIVFAAWDTVETLMNGLVEATKNYDSKIIEIIEWIVGSFVENSMGIIDAGYQIVSNLVEGISQAIPEFIPNIIDRILSIFEYLIKPENISKLVKAGTTLLKAIAQGLIDGTKMLVSWLPDVVKAIVNGLKEGLPILIQGVVDVVNMLIESLPEIIYLIADAIPQIIETFVDLLETSLPQILDGIIQIIEAIAENLPTIIQALVDAIPVIIEAILNGWMTALPIVIQAFVKYFIAIAEHMPEIIGALIEAIPMIIEAIYNGLLAFENDLKVKLAEFCLRIWQGVVEWWEQTQQSIAEAWTTFMDAVKMWFEDLPYNLGLALGDMIVKLGDWILEVDNWVKNELPKIIDAIVNWFAELPGRIWNWLVDVVNKYDEWKKESEAKVQEVIPQIIDSIAAFFEELPEKALQWGKDMIQGFIDGVGAMAQAAWDSIESFVQGIADRIGHSHPKTGPLARDYEWMPDMMELFAEGIEDNAYLVNDAIEKSMDFSDMIVKPDVDYQRVYQNDTGAQLAQMVALLQELVDGGMDVSLEGDAREIFRVVEKQNRQRTKATGYNSLAMAGG